MAEAEAQAMGTTSTGDLILYEAQNGIAVLTLNDPPANTYTHEMMLALDSAILKARMDEGVQVMAAGELFEFEVARELGLVNLLYVADTRASFMDQVLEYAAQFTTPNKAAGAVGRIKRSIQTGAEISFEAGLALERELQQQLFQSEDAKEGLDAYVNKRKPQFKGK